MFNPSEADIAKVSVICNVLWVFSTLLFLFTLYIINYHFKATKLFKLLQLNLLIVGEVADTWVLIAKPILVVPAYVWKITAIQTTLVEELVLFVFYLVLVQYIALSFAFTGLSKRKALDMKESSNFYLFARIYIIGQMFLSVFTLSFIAYDWYRVGNVFKNPELCRRNPQFCNDSRATMFINTGNTNTVTTISTVTEFLLSDHEWHFRNDADSSDAIVGLFAYFNFFHSIGNCLTVIVASRSVMIKAKQLFTGILVMQRSPQSSTTVSSPRIMPRSGGQQFQKSF
ncbi:unnamed protein product, partial [Mesorhabditis spiculigera]